MILEMKRFNTWPNLEHRNGAVVISLCFVKTDALWCWCWWMDGRLWLDNVGISLKSKLPWTCLLLQQRWKWWYRCDTWLPNASKVLVYDDQTKTNSGALEFFFRFLQMKKMVFFRGMSFLSLWVAARASFWQKKSNIYAVYVLLSKVHGRLITIFT